MKTDAAIYPWLLPASAVSPLSRCRRFSLLWVCFEISLTQISLPMVTCLQKMVESLEPSYPSYIPSGPKVPSTGIISFFLIRPSIFYCILLPAIPNTRSLNNPAR